MRRRPVTVDTGNMTGRTERVSNSGRQRGARARKKRMVVPGGGQGGHGGQERGLGAEGGEVGTDQGSQDPVTVTLVIHVSPQQQLDLARSQARLLASVPAGATGSTLPKQAKSRCAMVAVRGPSMIRPPQATRWEAHAGAEVCFSGFPPAGWWPLCVVGLVTPTRPLTSDDRVKWFGPLKGSRL